MCQRVLITLLDVESHEVESVAKQVIDEISGEFSCEDRSPAVNCSMGVSTYPEHGTEGQILIDHAGHCPFGGRGAGAERVSTVQ